MDNSSVEHGQAIALIAGEVYSSNLKYNDQGKPSLRVVIKYKLRVKRGDFSYCSNMLVFMGAEAERLATTLVCHDETNHINGTFLAALSVAFGSYKLPNNQWSHSFWVSKYKIYERPEDFTSLVEANQDPLVLRLGDILGIEG